MDRNELVPMIDSANRMMAEAGVDEEPAVLLADAGYWSHQNATAEVSCELLIASTTSSKSAQVPRVGSPRASPSTTRRQLLTRPS